jgi:hypothetical protein
MTQDDIREVREGEAVDFEGIAIPVSEIFL